MDSLAEFNAENYSWKGYPVQHCRCLNVLLTFIKRDFIIDTFIKRQILSVKFECF